MPVSATSPSDVWRHNTLRSAEPTPANISLDYQYKRGAQSPNLGSTVVTDPLWLNVQRPDLGPNDKVHAVWLEGDRYRMGSPNMRGRVSEVELAYAGNGRFTAELPDTVAYSGAAGGAESQHVQQLALQVDGDWLTDPVNQTHNFNVNLTPSPDVINSPLKPAL